MKDTDRIMENRSKGEKRVLLSPPHDRWHLCNGSSFQAGNSSLGAPVVPFSLLVPPAEKDESICCLRSRMFHSPLLPEEQLQRLYFFSFPLF